MKNLKYMKKSTPGKLDDKTELRKDNQRCEEMIKASKEY